jgi:hypothetical protein
LRNDLVFWGAHFPALNHNESSDSDAIVPSIGELNEQICVQAVRQRLKEEIRHIFILSIACECKCCVKLTHCKIESLEFILFDQLV